MAAGVGEASAIATFLQIGFSLAKTLSTYIADFKDTPNEISGLAEEIHLTLGHVEELNALLDRNQINPVWNGNGVKWAHKCRADSERVVQKLLKLLKKSGTSIPSNGTVGRQDIDISLFNRVSWPRLRPQIELVQRELERNRVNILLLISFYEARVASSQAAQRQASNRISDLMREKRQASKKLREARRKQDALDRSQGPRPRFNLPEKRRGRGRTRFRAASRSPSAHRRGDSPSESMFSTSNSLEDEQIAQLEDEIRQRILREDDERRLAEEQRQKVESDAVDKYKKSIVNKVAISNEQAEKLKESLREYFEHALSKEEIARYVKEQQAKETGDEVFDIIAALTGEPETKTVNSLNPAAQKTVVTQTGWRRAMRMSAATSGNLTLSATDSQVPSALRYQQSIEGCANITSILASFDDVNWNILPVHIPMPWLIDRLRQEESRMGDVDGDNSLTEYLTLPDDCRAATQSWLQRAIGDQKAFHWVLVYAHPLRNKGSKARRIVKLAVAGMQGGEDVHSVLLVFRASRDPSGTANGMLDRHSSTPSGQGINPHLSERHRADHFEPVNHPPFPSFSPQTSTIPPPSQFPLGSIDSFNNPFHGQIHRQPPGRPRNHPQPRNSNHLNANVQQPLPTDETERQQHQAQTAGEDGVGEGCNEATLSDTAELQEPRREKLKVNSGSSIKSFMSISLILEASRWKILPARLSKDELKWKMEEYSDGSSTTYNSLPAAARTQVEEWLLHNVAYPAQCELVYAEVVNASMSKRTRLLRRILWGSNHMLQGGSVLLVFSGKQNTTNNKVKNDETGPPGLGMPNLFDSYESTLPGEPNGFGPPQQPTNPPPAWTNPDNPLPPRDTPVDIFSSRVPSPPTRPPYSNPFQPDTQFGRHSPPLHDHHIPPSARVTKRAGPTSHDRRSYADPRIIGRREAEIEDRRDEIRNTRRDVDQSRNKFKRWDDETRSSDNSYTEARVSQSSDEDNYRGYDNERTRRARFERNDRRTTASSSGYHGPHAGGLERHYSAEYPGSSSLQWTRPPPARRDNASDAGNTSRRGAIHNNFTAGSDTLHRYSGRSYLYDDYPVGRVAEFARVPNIPLVRRERDPSDHYRRSKADAKRHGGVDLNQIHDYGSQNEARYRSLWDSDRFYISSNDRRLERVDERSEPSRAKGNTVVSGAIVRDRLRRNDQPIGQDSSDDSSILSVGLNDDELGHMMLVKFTGEKNAALTKESSWPSQTRTFIADGSGHITVRNQVKNSLNTAEAVVIDGVHVADQCEQRPASVESNDFNFWRESPLHSVDPEVLVSESYDEEGGKDEQPSLTSDKIPRDSTSQAVDITEVTKEGGAVISDPNGLIIAAPEAGFEPVPGENNDEENFGGKWDAVASKEGKKREGQSELEPLIRQSL